MCMKNRLSKISKPSASLLCLLAACGLTYSCTDDYKLDDEKPSWLNSSIYQGLQERGVFSTYLRLLSDKDVNPANVRPLSEVLSRTGSKTVFVANDEAYNQFFRHNATLPESDPWHYATSYEALSPSQKKLLIHTSMLNNAIVMENLASSEAVGANATPIRGEYLRRYTDVNISDTITFLQGNQIPHHYNPSDKDYWKRFRSTENGGTGSGIHLVMDATSSMMIHFTTEQMSKAQITDDDFAKIMGIPRITEDVHIYDSKLLDKDQVCENGYINVTEKVIRPLPNMAEIIRINGKTNIFSHILDRFSAPFYSELTTGVYQDLHPEFTDSIFVKRYFSMLSANKLPLTSDPDGEPFRDSDGEVALKFDPGWNAFYDEVTPERDMAAMFVPSDEAMKRYFSRGGEGWELIETYCDPNASHETLEDLYQNIDKIPMSTIQALVNIIMFRSFNGSVPSKMFALKDDANEQIFYEEDRQKIDTVLLGCNGAVYVMDKVYGPADYTSVAAPAYISKNNLVMKWAIYNGEKQSADNPDMMGLNYYAYLKAMRSNFTLFLPSDEALKYYYDPISVTTRRPRVLEFTYKSVNSASEIPVKVQAYRYDVATGEKGGAYIGANNVSIDKTETVSRLKDILESHTIVHDGTNPIDSEDEYYLTKNGSAVKVVRNEQGQITQVLGGFQLENLAAGITTGSLGSSVCNTIQQYRKDNGITLTLDAPIIPTSKSVYNILSNKDQRFLENPFESFYALCQPNEDIIKGCGLVDEKLSATQQANAMKKFNIFIMDNGLDYNVQFFNNYRYTVLVPNNAAIQDAINKGLPTWEEIEEDYNNCKDENDQLTTQEDSLRIQAKITYLLNFIRCHFADNSLFADKTEKSEQEFVTASFDSDNGIFVKINMWRAKEGGETKLKVKDNYNGTIRTVTDTKNIMARDVSCSKAIDPTVTSMNGIRIDASSFAVIHQIDGVLNHTKLSDDGKYEINWNSPSAVKRYLRKYHIR